MSAADDAYAAAVNEIRRVRAAGEHILFLNKEPYRALETIPEEINTLTSLWGISLDKTSITDLGPLANLTALMRLDFNRTPVTQLLPLSRLTAIRSLSLDETSVTDLAPLSGLIKLENLYLDRTPIADLAPVAELFGLRRLSLSKSAVTDLGPVARLVALETLYLKQTAVTDLAPIAGLIMLRRLALNQTAITDLAPIASLFRLEFLSLSKSAITDLTPISGLSSLRSLHMRQTLVTDLSPIAKLAGLQQISLDNAKVADLRPIIHLDKLGTAPMGLTYKRTMAAETDGELARLAEIKNHADRARQTLAYLATLPPWPEPLPWVPPQPAPENAPPPPDPDRLPRVDIAPEGLDLAPSPIDPADLSDPIKTRLFARLLDAAAALLRHGNRYPEVAGPARELVTLTSVEFESADLLDIHLQLAALTDVRSADADRPQLERLDPDCRTALDAVLRIGPGVTLGHPDVDALETRLAEYARLRQPATVAEGERRVTGALAEREELATERLRKVAAQVSKAGDEGRLPEYRRGFSRNVIIALGVVASGLTEAAQGYVYGEIAIAAAQFLVVHKDAIMATAPAWGQTGYAWLEYILVRADLILRDAKSRHLNKP